MEVVTISVNGMACGGCSSNIEKQLNTEEGIENVSASYLKKSVAFSFDPETISIDRAIDVIEEAGFEVISIGNDA